MAQSVIDIFNERLRLVKLSENELCNFYVPPLIVATDVVDLPGPACMEDKINSPAMIFNRESTAPTIYSSLSR